MFKLTSSAFAPGGEIPSKHTCESLALIVDDPDAPDPAAPKMTSVHWVLYNIAPNASALAEGARALPPGTLQGLNEWKRTGYGGPCPPIGRHRYFHQRYALSKTLPNLGQVPKPQLEAAMKPHVS